METVRQLLLIATTSGCGADGKCLLLAMNMELSIYSGRYII